jgi:hypothetical protein
MKQLAGGRVREHGSYLDVVAFLVCIELEFMIIWHGWMLLSNRLREGRVVSTGTESV